jgi:anti-sigma factor RsiW
LVNCSWCEERFERLLDGNLNPRERARVLGHVDACRACRGLLEELRVVDALLLGPRAVELPPNFTFATMAEVRAMTPPSSRRPAIAASLVSYVVAAWSLLGAAALIAPGSVFAAGKTSLVIANTTLVALGGLGHVVVHLGDRGDMRSWTTVAGGVAIADGLLLVAIGAALRAVRPRIAERLRW